MSAPKIPTTNSFRRPGKIEQLREPSGPGVRLDSGVYPGWTVPLEYDPLLAKLVTWGPDRNAAIQRLERALSEYAITGIQTNIAFFREILDDPEFRAGNLSTEFIADFLAQTKAPARACRPSSTWPWRWPLWRICKTGRERATARASKTDPSRWLTEGRGQLLR